MNKILSIAILAGVAVVAHADFLESFDTGPTGFVNGATVTFGNAGGTAMAFSSGSWFAKNDSAPNGTTGWFCNATGVFPTNSGAGHLNANFNNSTGSNAIDNYMMSPNLTFNNGDVISFFTRTVDAPFFPDRLMLKLSTAGAATTTSSFSTTLLTVNNTLTTTGYPSVYTQFSVTLSGLGGPTSGRFAFNYNVPNAGPSGANSDFIGIDDVKYTAAAVPEPASMAVLGLGFAALLRRRRNK